MVATSAMLSFDNHPPHHFTGGLIIPPGNPCGVHMDSRTPWMFHGFHGIFFGSGHTQIQFFSPWTVHGQSTYYHDFYNFHGIHVDSPWTPHGLSPRIIHGWHRTGLLNKSLVIIISCNPRIPYGLSLH